MNKNETSWGGVAGWYDEMLEKQDGTYQKEVILPNLLRLLSPNSAQTPTQTGNNSVKNIAHARPLTGQLILDLACGQGFFSRAYASAGAKVIASDIAKELISLAESHTPNELKGMIQYHVSPADQIDFCKDASMDVVTIILAIQNIENLYGVFRECARVLKPGGRLLLVLNHPSFRIPKRSSWEWGNSGRSQYRRIDAYMSDTRERIEMNPGEDAPTSKKFTVSFHRPLQVYFKTFAKTGFAVTRLEEWVSHKLSKVGPRSEEENRIRKEIPMFLFLEAKKGI